ncbi:HAMP domain-containing sensor histidine kinase [Halorubrum sp. AD140]|uniref:sensor histidine kinase n=1 Tax=Halorubrum sp. AD140 TaxID=3050073 RepID=UPI002ACC79C6|nr:HAMP domain-containing sensor histidine kinase [Halorubrum sp. AD140]MDZ5811779.1 HAMP domain-containing sensor histidine kinase [Halorubrum sp. AD140]
MGFPVNRLYDRSPRVLALAYLCVGALLVPAVDVAVASLVGGGGAAWSPARLAGGWTAVALSSLFVYGALTYHRRQAETVRRELETSNQQLQVLSRVFRHNIRNDLNVIRGYADLLADRVDDDRSRECLETIRRTTDDVVAISEKLRVIEETSPDPPAGRIDLVSAAREAAADVDDPDVTVTMEAPGEAWIRADRSVEYPIREVFENAVTHNDESSRRIDARIEENGTTTCLEVRDNGPGIPPDERAVLRAERETPLSHASSIGLWLVKWMCETQGGTVGFETSDDGTTVRLRFDSADVVQRAEGSGGGRTRGDGRPTSRVP